MIEDQELNLPISIEPRRRQEFYRVIIVDDEPDAIKVLSHLLKDFSDRFEIVAKCSDVKSAKQEIRQECPDLVFLDIRMPESSGFDLAAYVEGVCPATKIIFTSAYHEYLREGYKVQPFDFLTKPLSPEELKESLERFAEKYPLVSLKANVYRIKVPTSRGQEFLAVDHIHHIEYFDRKSIVYQSTGAISFSILSLSALLELLPKKKFIRLNKNTIVNVDYISVVNKNTVELKAFDKQKEFFSFIVGRAFMSDLKELLELS